MKRVLLVEDNRIERKLILHLLQEYFSNEVKIDEVSEGVIALTYLANLEYDLVITDLIMPQLDGIELIRKIKLNHSACKIIAISGSKPFYLYIAIKLGVNGVFTKPLDHNQFLNAVMNLLDLKMERPSSKEISVANL